MWRVHVGSKTGVRQLHRSFSVGVPSAAMPSGMCALPLRDTAETLEAIAEAYVSMDLQTMRKFHELVVNRAAHPPPTASPLYEEMLLQGFGCSTSAGGATVASSPSVPASAASVTTADDAAPKKKASEKSVFDVSVKKYPAANKVKLIKEVRALSGLPLQEAKAAVEKCPGIVVKALARADAEKLKSLLEGHGAEVELL